MKRAILILKENPALKSLSVAALLYISLFPPYICIFACPMNINKNKMTSDSCILCNAIIDSIENGIKSIIENRLLYSTKSFIVTPCISPIEPGHVLITSKNHYQNLSCMEMDNFVEIQSILNFVNEKMPEFYSNFLVAEHGAYDYEQNSGACIIHTHLHLIPNCNCSISAFDKILDFTELKGFYQIKEINYPYILAATNDIFKIYHADNVPSQMIRRLVLANRGETNNWDWRLNTNQKYNELTIKMWNDVE